MKSIRILAVLLSIGLLAVGCSQEPEMTAPETPQTVNYDKNGTETLGPPTIDIAAGTCFSQGGVGMVGKTEGTLEIDVPDGTITQVLLYWAGGTTGAPGDDMIMIDGNEVTGELIGGPTNFFQSSGVSYYFSAYRADITDLALVTNGANSFTITDFDFDFTGGSLDENNGIGMMVIYDDGTEAELQVLDGLDLAFYQFDDPLDATVPQTFTFAAEDEDRLARMVIYAGSVGFERPNGIALTTSAGTDLREDLLGSTDDLLWDTLCLTDILIPAGDTSLTVELISTAVANPLGASMAWVGAGFALPVTPETYCIGDYVWYDANRDGCQDTDEMPAEGVEVNLWAGCPPTEVIATTMTDSEGYYAFCELMPGDYTVQFVAPEGYYFCEQFSDACDEANDSNAGEDGITDCVTIVDADDWTIDAALCEPLLGCLGDYVWLDENMDGIQDETENGFQGVTVILLDCLGEELATTVTDVDGKYMFCELPEGEYMVKFMLPVGYEFSPQDQGGDDVIDSDADVGTGLTVCIDLAEGEHDYTWDAGIYLPVVEEIGCRMTGGGNDVFYMDEGMYNEYTFGGQAGAPIASQPQPWGNWTHTQKKGAAGSFTFHGGTPSAPDGTEIDWIECSDPGWCVQARQAPAKQLDFGGVGTFKNLKGVPAEIADHVVKGESLHWFEVNIDDLGEPGSHNEPDGCDPLGFGRNGGTELADCGCPDFYRIRIHEGMDDSSPVMYEVYGYIDGGNFQIHPPTGRDRQEWN
jgi:hypothetical protein